MDASEMKQYLCRTFAGVDVAEASGDTFFTYDPDGDLPPERTLPFATLVTGDNYDSVSRLSRPGAYRLNIGLTKAGFTSLFGAAPTERDDQGILRTGFDYAEPDRVMPHPVYGSQYWVCVVTPGTATLDTVQMLLAEAYTFAIRKHENHRRRRHDVPE